MTRQVVYVFFGTRRTGFQPVSIMKEHHEAQHDSSPHESPRVMTTPLAILATFSILLGFLGTPALPWFQGFLSGETEQGGLQKLFESPTLGLLLLSSAVVFLGIGLGWWLYGRTPITSATEPDVLEKLRPDIFALLRNKYYVDEIYEWSLVRLNAVWA